MLEIHLFVNPLGMRCFRCEQDVLRIDQQLRGRGLSRAERTVDPDHVARAVVLTLHASILLILVGPVAGPSRNPLASARL